jgi:hypothetical protein
MAVPQASSAAKASAGPQKPAPVNRNDALSPGQAAEQFVAFSNGTPIISGRPEEILTLQRKVGNRAVGRLLPARRTQRQQAGGSVPQHLIQPPTPAIAQHNAGPEASIQREEENEKPLSDIQYYAMFGLLPALAALPEKVRTDKAAGQKVGGPRLVTAMNVVAAKGTPWMDFVAGHNGELASLPQDQIADIITYLGAPKDARYFKGEEFDNKFDGAVDPAKGVVTLYFRVRFLPADGARFGASLPGTPGWEEETQQVMQKFQSDFKRVVEAAWSQKGTLKPGCPIGQVKSFQTKVSISIVDGGEHTLMYVAPDVAGGRSSVSQEEKIGTLRVSANEIEPKDVDHPVMDEQGHRAGTVSTEQPGSAHEFGHAVGLSHPSCKHGDDICYGKTREERESIMGAGQKLSVIQRKGDIKHNDFEPFLKIARRWGQDVFQGALQGKCNNWTAG